MVTTWLEEVRRHKIECVSEFDAEAGEAHREDILEQMDLDAALAKLPAEVRLCVVLAYNEGMSHSEIAQLTNLPVGTVKSHISRGAARLREMLASYAGS
jgi:RNA polymerase sigma-70 factor (ECF subfamily)